MRYSQDLTLQVALQSNEIFSSISLLIVFLHNHIVFTDCCIGFIVMIHVNSIIPLYTVFVIIWVNKILLYTRPTFSPMAMESGQILKFRYNNPCLKCNHIIYIYSSHYQMQLPVLITRREHCMECYIFMLQLPSWTMTVERFNWD